MATDPGISASWRYGRLNWLQQNWLRGDPNDEGTAHENNLERFVPTPEFSVMEILEALTKVVARHESLRTTVTFDQNGNGSQVVPEPPCSVSDIEHVVEVVDRDQAPQLIAQRRATAFDIRREWPAAFVVVRDGERVPGIYLAVDHSAADAWGLKVLGEDIVSALEAGSALAERPVAQPLDTVDWEESSDGVRRSGRALDFWRRQLNRVADESDLASTSPGQDEFSAILDGSGIHQLRSLRLRDAAELASARLSVSMEIVFLSAYGWALAAFNETAVAGIMGMHMNRFAIAEMNSVALRFTHAPLVVERPNGGPIEPLVKQFYRDRLDSMRVGHAHPAAIDAVIDEVLPAAMSPAVCGAQFTYDPPALNGSLSKLPIDRGPRDERDDVIRGSEILARGSNLMVRVDFKDAAANIQLISNVHSRIHRHGSDFLRLMADSIYWMASGDAWSKFPRPRW